MTSLCTNTTPQPSNLTLSTTTSISKLEYPRFVVGQYHLETKKTQTSLSSMDRNLDGGIYGDNGGGVAVGGIIGGTWFAARSNTHMIVRSIDRQISLQGESSSILLKNK